jgi:hypothetical protein
VPWAVITLVEPAIGSSLGGPRNDSLESKLS